MSEVRETRFIDLCVRGEALPAEIDDFVELWHEGDSTLPLHEFLGMTSEEYSAWVRKPDLLPYIVTAHREGQTLQAAAIDTLLDLRRKQRPVSDREVGRARRAGRP